MNYTWKLSKYSKFLLNPKDKYSYCNQDLDDISQTITHSQYDTQSVYNEKWLHIHSHSNLSLEVFISHFIEIRLNIQSFPNVTTIILEHLQAKDKLTFCAKQKILGCKTANKKFQITFFNIQETTIFIEKFNKRFGGGTRESLIRRFILLVGEVEVDEEIKRKIGKLSKRKLGKRDVSFLEIKREFLMMLQDDKPKKESNK